MTSKDWQFVQTNFVKNYIIFSSANDDLFESFTLNCFSLAKNILDKHWQDESWSESWDPPYAIPLIINLKKPFRLSTIRVRSVFLLMVHQPT